MKWAQFIWGKQVGIDQGVVYFDRQGNPAVYVFTVFRADGTEISPADIRSRVVVARQNRLVGDSLLAVATMQNDRAKILQACERIEQGWAAMRDEETFATLVLSADPQRLEPVKFYAGLPPHYVSLPDAEVLGRQRLNVDRVDVTRYLYDGLFEFFVELSQEGKRTIVDLLDLERSTIPVETLLSAFLAQVPLKGSATSSILTKNAQTPVKPMKEPGEDVESRYIYGVPDYQTIKSKGCAPTASGCVLGYWDDHGYDRMVDGGNSSYAGTECIDGYWTLIYCELGPAMGYVEGVGTYVSHVDDGIYIVANVINGYTFDVSNGTWYASAAADRSAFQSEVQAEYPPVYTMKHPFYGGAEGYHSVAGVGYYNIFYEPIGPEVYYRVVLDNNSATGYWVFLNETDIVDQTHLITVHPGGLPKTVGGNTTSEMSTFALTTYPNPFNPTTTIRYSLAERSSATLSIFNLQGQRVREFSLGMQETGDHTLIWGGDDQKGRPVSAGVYLLELKTDHHHLVRRLTLVK